VTTRREILLGAACMATAGAAYALTPRRRVSLLGKRQMIQIVPHAFDGWTSRDVSDLVAPQEDSLASRLYGQTVGRVYTNPAGGPDVMMLMAHGDTQNDDLQLHRPEICYPFFGYAITQDTVADLALAGPVSLPCRQLVAQAPDREESILYWSRLGEFLPLDRRQQQLDRLRTAMHGDVADGVLSRMSIAGASPEQAFSVLQDFIPRLVKAISPRDRAVVIGSERANQLIALHY
jgi:EpsI family protein